MKSKKLSLNKITLANLNPSLLEQVRGGGVTVIDCNTEEYTCGSCTSTCPIPCAQSKAPTCELFCTTMQANTCDPCIP